MKKFLPILIFTLFFAHFFFSSPKTVFAEEWINDNEVTFVGKTAARSGAFLDWTLKNYDWVCVAQVASSNRCDNSNNPLIDFWIIIRNIVYAVIALFVLATAFIVIITRGKSITIMRFIPRFVLIFILVTLSFALVQFLYQIGDLIQYFFLHPRGSNSEVIQQTDLLFVGFDYKAFIGYRLLGSQNDESAFMSLILVRLTAITYYVMTGILLIRKIILWFFIILSPVFPLLLFYAPIRNTGKIWIGEFFRWLLYAPLFAIFLNGLVRLWSSGTGIPLAFPHIGDAGDVAKIIYPTAIDILLAGPGQPALKNNSVNLPDTFALYVVALLMLWVVILLPFLLLKIFLDYLNTVSFGNNLLLKQVINKNLGFLKPPGTPPPGTPPPGLSAPTGAARTIPFFTAKKAVAIPVSVNVQNTMARESADVLRLANLSIPKMRDIARYESSLLSNDVSRRQEVNTMRSNLTKIANPTIVAVPGERERFSTIHQKLVSQKQRGNPIASSILSASSIASQTSVTTGTVSRESQKFGTTGVISRESQKFGTTGVVSKEMIANMKKETANLPVVNRVQQVSVEDYEEVRKMWTENYQNVEPPKDINGQPIDREKWIRNDMDNINKAITLLTSIEPARVNEGMEMVANILPFLLIGGFSKTEVISYLKAKLEAGKSTLFDTAKKEEEEDTQVVRKTEKEEKPKEMTEEVAVDKKDNEEKNLVDMFPEEKTKVISENKNEEKKEPSGQRDLGDAQPEKKTT
ncbi:MAG: hypothetical protein CO136_00995 [Candidatus Levybacteria bacterium CG_4_9_14_3_um_filter_36_7]|nr:MAG: hypothetical protein CO136_00995 [Candidatus Levybacteria bacterium CG_4_9_14_3_um_filter_36_7]